MKKIIIYLRGYIKRSYLWRDLLRQPFRLIALLHLRENSRKEALDWASKNAMSLSKAVDCITKGAHEVGFINERHKRIVEVAEKEVSAIDISLGGPGAVNLLYTLIRWKKPKVVLETGVALGWSSLAILLALDDIQSGQLISIDRPDMKLSADDAVGAAVVPELYHRWKLLRGVDRDQLPKALQMAGNKLDIAHYDSDKSYYGRWWAYHQIWEALRRGGLLISDDIEDNTAFMDFCHAIHRDPVVVKKRDGFAGVICKGYG